MPKHARAALLLALGLAALGFARAADDDSQAVRAVLDAQVEAWNRKDLDGFLAGYWNNPGTVFLSGGDRSDGFEAMRDRYRKRYQGEGRAMGRLEFSGVEIMKLSTDSALARGRWGLTMPDGKRPAGLFTLILRKKPEGWRIIHDHTSAAT